MTSSFDRLVKARLNGQPTQVTDLLKGDYTFIEPAGTVTPSTRWMFDASGVGAPIAVHTASASQVYSLGEIWRKTADYPQSEFILGWSNWWTSSDGSNYPETDNTNSIVVRASISFDDGASWQQITFNQGQTSITIAAGQTILCDSVHPSAGSVTSASCRIRTFCVVNEGERRPGGYSSTLFTVGVPNGLYPGCRYTADQNEALNLLQGGSFTANNTGSAASYYGPSVMLGRGGWDGRGVVFVAGDSIAQLTNWHSWIVQGLEDTTGGALRLPLYNIAVPGTRPANSSSRKIGAWKRKAELMAQCIHLNPGSILPFTAIFCQHGVNQSGSSEVTWKNWMAALWKYLKREYPGVPLTQSTLTPRTTRTAGTATWDTSNQQLLLSSNAVRWRVNAYIKNAPGQGLIDHVLDNDAVWTDSTAVKPTAWRVPTWTTTVAADYVAGSGPIVLTDAPELGTVLSPATATNTQNGRVLSVTGSGPYTVTLDSSATVVGTAPAGTVVRLMNTRDGLHPERPATDDAVANVRIAKNAGYFD